MREPCPNCDGGIITTRDPKDPPGILTFTVCTLCSGDGSIEGTKDELFSILRWAPVVLLVPNFLLFA